MEEKNYLTSLAETYKKIFPKADVAESGIIDSYTNTEEEYYAFRRGVSVRDISSNSLIELRGEVSLDFLHRISTNIMNELPVSKARRTLFTNEKGRLIDRTTIINFTEFVLVCGSYENKSKLLSWLRNFAHVEPIELKDVSGKYLILEFAGPQAESYLTLIAGKALDSLEKDSLFRIGTDGFELIFYRLENIAGQQKFWMIGDMAKAESIIEYVINSNIVFDLKFAGRKAFDIFRIEQGIPSAPEEINLFFNPYDINLISEVSFNKGCYIGQEVIAKIESSGKAGRNLYGAIFDEPLEMEETLPVQDAEGNEAGKLTSVAKSGLTGKFIGLTVLKAQGITEGQTFFAVKDGNKLKFKVTKLPFKR